MMGACSICGEPNCVASHDYAKAMTTDTPSERRFTYFGGGTRHPQVYADRRGCAAFVAALAIAFILGGLLT